MCRNITMLRGLEPPATADEVEAAARQFVRKISGVTNPNPAMVEAFEAAVAQIAAVSADLLVTLPPRRTPPPTLPPLRRLNVRRSANPDSPRQPRAPRPRRPDSDPM